MEALDCIILETQALETKLLDLIADIPRTGAPSSGTCTWRLWRLFVNSPHSDESLTCTGTQELFQRKEPNAEGVKESCMLRLNSQEILISAVHQHLDRQGDHFLKQVFDKFSAINEGFVNTEGLYDALIELGMPAGRNKVEELMVTMDLDESGGLNFEEFKLAVKQPPTQLEQWASMLPLSGILARSLPISSGQGDQPLRDFSRLHEDEINLAVEVFSKGLKRLLMQAKATSRQMFDSMDEKASEAAKDTASSVSAASKYKTFKMSTGKVEAYYEGISGRVGALLNLHA
jgi:hypothetical protein